MFGLTLAERSATIIQDVQMPDSGKACAQSMGLLFARRKAEQLMGVQKSVNDMKIGEQGTVVGLGCSGALRRRIIDMGITPARM